MPPKKQSAWSRAAEAANKQRQNAETEKQESIEAGEPQKGLTLESQNGIMQETQSGITDNLHSTEAALLETAKEENSQSGIALSPRQGETIKSDSIKSGEKQTSKTVEQQNEIADNEDKPTEKITLYLTWKQLDKLDNMALEYKRRTRKRTDHNKLMRMMVDKFGLDDLLS